jgi:superfamily II DNA or RNA helicase
VLSKTYGSFADLRRELADSRAAVTARGELLRVFATCADSQRGWLLLEDYFERLSLTRKDFPGEEWWPKLLAKRGDERLEELAVQFLRHKHSLPPELQPHTNLDRFAELEESEREQDLLSQMERWMFPPAPEHLDQPRAQIRVVCVPVPDEQRAGLHTLSIRFHLSRPRTGEKVKSPSDLMELISRATHEKELFPPADWEFIEWVAENHGGETVAGPDLRVSGGDLVGWLARWGDLGRLQGANGPLRFLGQIAELVPHLQNGTTELSFTHQIRLPDGRLLPLSQAIFFAGRPTLALEGNTFYLLRNSPPEPLLALWLQRPLAPVAKLSQRFLTRLRKSHPDPHVDWDQLCMAHAARPQFVFEMIEDRVQLRLLARSERDGSLWHWAGHEWQLDQPAPAVNGKPEILDDPRLDPAVKWLRRLDWFTPEAGLWIGDASENFLNTLAGVWPDRPGEAEYLGNTAFHRLFLAPRKLKPRLLVQGSGIDWLSVSAEWEREGLQLSKADLARLAAATTRFVKLPDGGWVEMDVEAVRAAHEMMADIGLEGLDAEAQRVPLEQAAHLSEAELQLFGDTEQAQQLRARISHFEGIAAAPLPRCLRAELRPYQKEGFDFLCHLTSLGLGGILADDMGLGKTLQTLTWLAWLREQHAADPKPSLVICPASVLHNWRREAEKFTPGCKVLVLESGAARHNLRKQIPQHDLIVTNYALLRRDLEELQKFDFRAVILDEAQFIKNPGAQVTTAVKQIRSEQRLALTGTPIENRLTDLWSIVDFVQPGYLGSAAHFHDVYEPQGESEEGIAARRIARRRLSSRLRPLLLRRLKLQVAKDLPERIEQRRDCELDKEQRTLYLAELRRSRDQVMQTVAEKGIGQSKLQVLAALTRLRQICCHPRLVGSDALSGKTEALMELVVPLVERGEKILVFSQFVQMLKIIEAVCQTRQIPTHMLTGETKQRQDVVNAFQADDRAGVFLLSLRAAGTGLNLTTASYVILYDPWWNPAVEAQAIDRSHRIGQTRTVNAYRLIAPGTVEEKIWELQQRKSQTIADVLGEEGFARSLSKTDLEFLFAED